MYSLYINNFIVLLATQTPKWQSLPQDLAQAGDQGRESGWMGSSWVPEHLGVSRE